MKELNTTTNSVAGGLSIINHELALSKIVSVSIFVTSSAGNDYPPGYGSSVSTGFQYFYYLTSTSIVIENSSTSYANIANRPARILITYKE